MMNTRVCVFGTMGGRQPHPDLVSPLPRFAWARRLQRRTAWSGTASRTDTDAAGGWGHRGRVSTPSRRARRPREGADGHLTGRASRQGVTWTAASVGPASRNTLLRSVPVCGEVRPLFAPLVLPASCAVPAAVWPRERAAYRRR